MFCKVLHPDSPTSNSSLRGNVNTWQEVQGCQWTLKTLKSLENEMVTLNDLDMLKYQERTLKSLDFYFFSLTLKTMKHLIPPLL